MKSFLRPLLALLMLLLPLGLSAKEGDAGLIFLDVLSFAGERPDTTRLDIYIAVPYQTVAFEREDGVYRARYQMRLRVEGAHGKAIDTTWTRSLRTLSYEVTVGRTPAVEFYQQRVSVPPGEYTVTLEIIDLKTNGVITLSQKKTAINFARERFTLSSPMLVSKIREDSSGGYAITPYVSDVVTGEDPFFLFFETVNRGDSVAASIMVRITDGSGAVFGPTQRWERMIPPGRAREWVRVSTTGLPRGRFTVELHAQRAADTTLELGRTSRMIRLEGGSFGITLNDEELNKRISQLRYVATPSEIDRIREGGALAERQRLYGEFWDKFDPTPGTPANEAMEEYFRRIDHANGEFRGYAEGWLTDKGRVWVLYGPPDNITTDPFRNDGKAVENWYYSRRNLRLTFIDESGFGDFRLTTPIPPGEKFRYP
jgi:GWxTD domain-containing protein